VREGGKAGGNGASNNIGAMNEQIVALIKEYRELKNIYILEQEDKLYNKWEINEANGRKLEDRTNRYAYVTFRSMKGKNRAEKVFRYAEDNSKQYQEEHEKKFFDQWLSCEPVIAPSNIKWRNVNVSFCERFWRSCAMWTCAFLLIFLAFCLMVWFKDFGDGVTMLASSDRVCPTERVPAEQALRDYGKHPKQRQGYFACFCLDLYNAGELSRGQELFQAAGAPAFDEDPCEAWEDAYSYGPLIVALTAIMISLINSLCVWLFEVLAPLEKCQTLPDETKAIFNKIVIVQFLNIACVLLFADFHLGP
jgi:hypothetical protein